MQTEKQELLLSLPLFINSLRQNKAKQPATHWSLFFHKSTELTAETEGSRQSKRREKKKEGGGVVVMAVGLFGLHSMCLCTVGQAVHVEQLESLCNSPPPLTLRTHPDRALSWVFIKHAVASLPPTSPLRMRLRSHLAPPPPVGGNMWFRASDGSRSHLFPLTDCQTWPDRKTKAAREERRKLYFQPFF